MKYVKTFINSARRNSDRNPKISIIEVLKKYVGNPNADKLFVTFTDLNKVGINPQSKFDTPLGIYSYPVKYVYNILVNDREVPFAGDKPYASILEAKSSAKPLDFSNYSNFDKDIAKVEEFYNSKYNTFNDLLKVAKDTAYRPSSLASVFWNLTRLISNQITENRASLVWNKLLRYVGYDYVIDSTGEGIIHSNEPVQCLFLSKNALIVKETVLNKKYNSTTKVEIDKSWIKQHFDPEQEVEAILDIMSINPSFLKNLKSKDLLVYYYDMDIYILKGQLHSSVSSSILGKSLANKSFSSLEDAVKKNKILSVTSNNQSSELFDCSIYGGYYNGYTLEKCRIYGGVFENCKISKYNDWVRGTYGLLGMYFINSRISPREMKEKLVSTNDKENLLKQNCNAYGNQSNIILTENTD